MAFNKQLRVKFDLARKDAAWRKVQFLLTFEDWLKIWEDSGHLAERGPRLGQYVMARFGDKGPYAVGNVKIILGTDNTKEGWLTASGLERKKALVARCKNSPLRANKFGHKLSEITKARMSVARLAWWERRRKNG